MFDTFFVFCTQTTRMFDNLSAALNAAYYESSIDHLRSVDVYAINSTDGSASIVVATVQARSY